MSKQIFVNVPVRDLRKAKPIADARRASEVMLALVAD